MTWQVDPLMDGHYARFLNLLPPLKERDGLLTVSALALAATRLMAQAAGSHIPRLSICKHVGHA